MHASDQEHLMTTTQAEREKEQQEIVANYFTTAQQAQSPLSLSSSSLLTPKQTDNSNITTSQQWWMNCKNTIAYVANKVGILTHKVQETVAEMQKSSDDTMNLSRECDNTNSLAEQNDMYKRCINEWDHLEPKNQNHWYQQHNENLRVQDNEHALFDLIAIDNINNNSITSENDNISNINIDNDDENDDDFSDSQMNDAFAYSSSSQSHYSNSTSSFHSSSVYSKYDNITNSNTSKANTNLHTVTDVPSSMNSNPFASENVSYYSAEKPLVIDLHKYNVLSKREGENALRKQNANMKNSNVTNTRMYQKLSEVWQKCKKVTSQLVKKRAWTVKQNSSRQRKWYLPPYSSFRGNEGKNVKNKDHLYSVTAKSNSQWREQEREEMSNEQCSLWNMPIVPDSVIYQLRSMVTLQIGQNADSTLHKSVQEVEKALELETTTATLSTPIKSSNKVPAEIYKIKESIHVQHINSAKYVHADSTGDRLIVPTSTASSEHVVCKSHKRARHENNNKNVANDAQKRLARELLQLATLLQNSTMQSESRQEEKYVKEENYQLIRICKVNGSHIEEEEQRCEQCNYNNYSENDSADVIQINYKNNKNDKINLKCSTSANHSFVIPSTFNHNQLHTPSNFNTSKSRSVNITGSKNSRDSNGNKLEALEHTQAHYLTSHSGLGTMHNENFYKEMNTCSANENNVCAIRGSNTFGTLAISKEENEKSNLTKLLNIEQQITNYLEKLSKQESNENNVKNMQSLCVEQNLHQHEKRRERTSNSTKESSIDNCRCTEAPLLNLVCNDQDVAIRKVYETLLDEFLQRAVEERVRRTLANLNDVTERGLSESILRQVLTHLMFSNSRKQTMEKETSTSAYSLQEQPKTNLFTCFSNVETNSSSFDKANTKYNTKEINSVRFTGVVQHIREGKPVMLEMLYLSQEDEEILNRVVSFRHNNHDNAISLNTPGYSMTYAQLGTLCSSCWLSDQVINNYLQLLCEEFCVNSVGQANCTGASTIASLGTHFYAKVQTELSSLTGDNYDYTYDANTQSFCWNFPPLPEKSAILRWLRRRSELLRSYKPVHKVNVSNKENQNIHTSNSNLHKNTHLTITQEEESSQMQNVALEENESNTCVRVVFIPVNIHDQHWALVVWNKETEELIYYDSLGRSSGYYRRPCLSGSLNHKYFMQNISRATPTRAERILAELDHVLSECQRHLLCATKTQKSTTITDSFSQSNSNNNMLSSANNAKYRAFDSFAGRNKSLDTMAINKIVNETYSKLGVEHVIADSYTASLHVLSDYKPFRSLYDLQTAQSEFTAKTRMNDINIRSESNNNKRNSNYEISWTMAGEECNNDISDMEIEWFAEGHFKVPRQSNGNDCGVFVCQVAWCVAHGVAVNFAQQDIHILRKVMILELWCKRILRRLPSMIMPSSCDVNLNTL